MTHVYLSAAKGLVNLQIHAEKSPFLTERLRVFMLPTLACVKKEKTVDYIVGFDELGGSDDFSTHTLAARLSLHGLITYEGTEDYGGSKPAPQARKGGMLLHRSCEHEVLDGAFTYFIDCQFPSGVQRNVRQGGERGAGTDDEDSDFE